MGYRLVCLARMAAMEYGVDLNPIDADCETLIRSKIFGEGKRGSVDLEVLFAVGILHSVLLCWTKQTTW